MVVTCKFRAKVNKSKGHNFIPSMLFFSHSSRCREAEPQCGPPHHMSRRPYWLPWGSVATAEHLHGPSFSAVHQGRVWERQRSKWSPLTLSFHYLSLQPLAKKTKTSIHFQNEGHMFTWRPELFFQSVHLFISLLSKHISFIGIHETDLAHVPSVHPSIHWCAYLFLNCIHMWLACLCMTLNYVFLNLWIAH